MLEKTGSVSYKIKNQLTNTVTKAYAEHHRAADVHKWDIPSPNRRICNTTLAAPVNSDSSDIVTAEEDGDDGFVRKRYECVRENSDNESDIPIMQCQLALNDEVDLEAIDRDSESSGCEQSSVGDSVAEGHSLGGRNRTAEKKWRGKARVQVASINVRRNGQWLQGLL